MSTMPTRFAGVCSALLIVIGATLWAQRGAAGPPEHVSKQPSGMGGFGSMGEGVTVDGQGNVYAGEVGPVQGLTKFVPRLKR